jgi:hypothetical protein
LTTSNRGRAPSRASGRACSIYEFGTESAQAQRQSQVDSPGQRLGQREVTAMP